jgi:hypothetical protein
MRKVLTVVICACALGTGIAVAGTTNGGRTNNSGAKVNYAKPGCGPWKTNGVAGNSGYHDGQPPKSPGRADCPKP